MKNHRYHSRMSDKPTVEEMIAALREQGFEVMRKARYVKHTFEVEENVLRAFKQAVEQDNKKIKDAATEALMLWIERSKR